MKKIKITDTDRFKIRPFVNRDAVTISVIDHNKNARMLTTLWGVEGTNAVADYCNAFIEARKSMEIARNIEQQYSYVSATLKTPAE